MKIVKLDDVCEIIAGQSPPSQFYNDQGIGLPFFQGKSDFRELHPIVRVWCSEPQKVAEAGDILISVRAPVGPTNLANQRCCIGRGLSAIRPSKKIDTHFLLQYFKAIEQKLSNMGNGSTFSAITQKDLRNIEIPLPPLAEQQRIAAILDQADALRAKRRAALAKLDTLLQATFLHMFGDPNVKMIPITEAMSAIIDYRGKTPPKTESGIPLVTAKIVKDGYIEVPNEFIAEDFYDEWMRRGFPEVGDVVFTTEAPLGKVAQLKDKNIALAQRIVLLRGDPRILNNKYLMHAMTTPIVRQQIDSRSTGSTVRGIRQKELRKVEIPVPSLEMQELFNMIASKIEEQMDKHQIALRDNNNLFHALQQRAFKGEL